MDSNNNNNNNIKKIVKFFRLSNLLVNSIYTNTSNFDPFNNDLILKLQTNAPFPKCNRRLPNWYPFGLCGIVNDSPFEQCAGSLPYKFLFYRF